MPHYQDTHVSKPVSRLARSGALGPAEVAAALAIEAAVVSILTRDIRSGIPDGVSRRAPSTGFAEDRAARFCDQRRAFYDWADEMARRAIAIGPVLDVIIEGKPLTGIDLAWKKRKGWARATLLSGLRLYLDLAARRDRHVRRLTA